MTPLRTFWVDVDTDAISETDQSCEETHTQHGRDQIPIHTAADVAGVLAELTWAVRVIAQSRQTILVGGHPFERDVINEEDFHKAVRLMKEFARP